MSKTRIFFAAGYFVAGLIIATLKIYDESYVKAALSIATGIALAISTLISGPFTATGWAIPVLGAAGCINTMFEMAKATERSELSAAFMDLETYCEGRKSEVERLSVYGAVNCKMQGLTDLSDGTIDLMKGMYLPPAAGFADDLSSALKAKPKNPCEAAVKKATEICPSALPTILIKQSESLRKFLQQPKR
jgi:hypothetical protein